MPLNSKPFAILRRYSLSNIHLWLAVAMLTATYPLSATAQTIEDTFPYSWFGEWRGTSDYVPVDGDTMAFDMELHIGPVIDSTRVHWKIVYIQNGERQERPYSLVTVDAQTGRFMIDEHNSITIPSALIEETLYSHFAVGSVQITSSYRRDGENLIVEMLSMNANAPDVSGGQDDIPQVTTYPVRGIQRATLRYVK